MQRDSRRRQQNCPLASVCQRPLCAKGAGSEADWGIVNGKATTDVRIIGAVGNPSAPAGHLPLHKGGKGAVRTQRRHPVGAAISRPPAQIPTAGNGRQIASPTVGSSKIQKVHDVIGNFPFTPWTDLICECYGLCRGIHAGDNRIVPLEPSPCPWVHANRPLCSLIFAVYRQTEIQILPEFPW